MKVKLTQRQAVLLLNMSNMAEWYLKKENARAGLFTDYHRESGAIITDNDTAITYISGTPASVEFPEEMIWSLHKARPGSVFKLAHTHGPHMDEPSSRDLQTLKTWAFALHPFPARLSVIALKGQDDFVEKTYIGIIESKEQWIASGKIKRDINIMLESKRYFNPSKLDKGNAHDSWLLHLLKESYGKEAN